MFLAIIATLLASMIVGTVSANANGINVSVTTTTVSGINYAVFNAVENGLAKEKVEIYIDDKLGGLTGVDGTYKVSGLTTGSHNWEAKYGGGTVGSGKFVFFGYNILAKGSTSPPQSFTYTITAKGTTYKDVDQYKKAEVKQSDFPILPAKTIEDTEWFHIDHTQTVHLTYSYISGADWLSWYNGGQCINPAAGEYQTLTPGDYYIYAGAHDTFVSRPAVKVEIWFTSRVNIPWANEETGSSSVSQTEGNKPIKTSSLNAPNGDTSWSVTKNTNSKVNVVMIGNKLYGSTNYREGWSQSESGTGSITDTDVDKLVISSSLVAPNKDTSYSLSSITINGTTVYDNDSKDQSKNPNEIKYSGISVWMTRNELHSSMLYHPPKALIDSISPKNAQIGQEITFIGHGENQDSGNLITAYGWRSHNDGTLSSNNSFTTSSLSPASHVIFFQAANNASLWSPEAVDNVRVNKPPDAYINSIKGTGVDANGYPTLVLGDSITFNGVGIDTDGHIAGYEWSTISEVLGSSESLIISDLPIGKHTIYFRVQDNDGAWSKKVSKEIVVRRTPVVYVSGYDWAPHAYGKVTYRPEMLDPLAYDDIKENSNLLIEPMTGDIIHWADRLSFEIDKLKRDTGTKKVDIVTFSTGSLNARWFIDKGYKNNVRKLISIAPPNHGLDVAYSTPVIEPFEPEMGGGSQLMPHSSFLQTLNGHDGCASTRDRGTDHINPYVQYYVIAGTDLPTLEHQHLRINWGWFKCDIYPIPWVTRRGDNVISLDSARLDGADFFVMPCGPGREDHLGFDDRGDVKAKVKEILKDDSTTNQNINQVSAASVKSNSLSEKMGDSSTSEESLNTSFQLLEPISDTIYSGESKSHTIQIDPATTRVIFNLNGLNESDLALISPTGKLIDPADPAVNYSKEAGYIVYEIPNPEIGNWTLKVTASNVPESGSYYIIVAYEETNLFVGPGTDKTQYKPNDPITVYAYAQGNGTPLKGAAISAEIQGPVFPSEKISLFDDGVHGDGEANDGIYANTYNSSSACGAYNVNVNATILKDGITYNRNACTTVWVESLPDLSISDSDISFSNSSPNHNDPVTITARIHNIGDGAAKDAKILLFDGDPAEEGLSIGEKTVDVSRGNISNITVQWNATYGKHVIHVIISPYNEFLEQNYSNNRAQANISVADTEPPVANAGPDQIVSLNTPVFFDGSLSKDNVGITNITWDTDNDNDVDLTGVNPVLIDGYKSVGTYTVKMTVNDAAGNGPKSDTMNVTVTSDYDIKKPTALAGPNQTVSLREPVFFDASKSSDNFGIASYQWDTDTTVDSDGDGIKDNDVDLVGQHPSLVSGYYTLGTHAVKLSIDDVAGNGPVNNTLYVNVVDTVAPNTTLTIYPVIPDGLNDWYVTSPIITLSSIDEEGGSGVSKAEYSFDGVSWNTYSEPFTIDTKGTVTIYYKSTDKAGNIETIKSKTIKIDTPPVADAGGPYNGSAGVALRLNGSKSYDPDKNLEDSIVSYEWDLDGDGLYNDASGESVEHTWDQAYSGNVSLRVTNSQGATGTNRTTINIIDVRDHIPPTIQYATLYPVNTTANSRISVIVNVTDNVGVSSVKANDILLVNQGGSIWNGSITALEGAHSVNISAVDGAGNVAWNNSTEYTALMPDNLPPSSIINLQSTNDTNWINWTWQNPSDPDFNHIEIYLNGIFQTNTSVEYFDATGLQPETSYMLSTRTVDNYGNINETWVNSTSSTASGSPLQSPIANFSGNVTEGYALLTVQFADLSENATECYWDFGDGANSTEQNPTHTYSATGIYTVNLTVSNAVGSNLLTKVGYIKVGAAPSIKLTSITLDPENFTGATTNAPGAWSTNIADPLAQINVKDDDEVLLNQNFSGGSLGEISVPLKPGDNNFTLICSNMPGAYYPGNEYYGAVLFFNGVSTPPQIAVYNSNGGSGNFSVQPAGTQIMGGANGGLLFDTAPGTSVYTAPDGTKVEVVSYIVNTSGNTDEVSWGKIGSDGNNDTIAKLTLRVTPPSTLTAAFSAFPTSGNAPLKVAFTDNSSGSPASWKWDFGDGNISTEQNPTHTYSKAGPYNITLTANNSAGSNTVTKYNYISIAKSEDAIIKGYAPLSVQFTDLSEGAISWKWSFGDGNISTEQNPTHTYSKAGQYTVTLTANNVAGSNVVTKYSYISVVNALEAPVAAFSAFPTSGKTLLNVSFTDKSTGSPTSWKWSFGDGNVSTEQNPTHTYSKAGQYTISLTVNNVAGSSAVTKYSYISVANSLKAPVANFSASAMSGEAPSSASY